MKCTVSVLLLCAGLEAVRAAAPLSQMERFSVAGREYVRLADWARPNGLQLSWPSPQQLRVASPSATFLFTLNSQRLSCNGVSLWLAAPVAQYKGAACVALVDLQATLQPLLWPMRLKGARRTKVICLDPGHGGKDTGNCEGKRVEKEYTLALARELAAQLRAAGYTVFLTRSWDAFVDLEERPESARRRGADLFISLHFNAAGSDVQGAEVYCLTPAHTASTNARGEGANTGALAGNAHNDRNILLAFQMQKALASRLGLEDRGVRRARWAVLRTARMPAVLVEGGFMSNAAELKNISSAAWRRQLAQALLEGVKSYQRLADPPAGGK